MKKNREWIGKKQHACNVCAFTTKTNTKLSKAPHHSAQQWHCTIAADFSCGRRHTQYARRAGSVGVTYSVDVEAGAAAARRCEDEDDEAEAASCPATKR